MELNSSVVVVRGAPEVFEYLADMSNNPDWQKGMKSCRWTSDGEIGVGSTYDQVATMMGREIRSSFEVTEFEPGRLIRIVTTESSFPIDVTRSVDPVGDESKVSAIVRGDSSGFFKLAEPVMKRMVKRSVDGDYARLKSLLESNEV
jgi:hypothetical protein